jgi:hypothetical protein
MNSKIEKLMKADKILELTKQKWAYFLVVTPILIYWVYWTLNQSYWFNIDPQAWYFIDSLAVFNGKSYTYVDHPGTPVHLIGSLLLALTYPFFGSREAFIKYYIAEPETFFFLANLFLLTINIFITFVLYKTAVTTLKYDRVLGAITLSLLFFSIHPHSFGTLTYWSHNSFNILGTLWLLWLFHEMREGKDIGWQKLVLLGFSAGILGMIQMYLLAWLAGGIFTVFVFALRLGKSAWQAVGSGLHMLAGGMVGIILMLIPIYQKLPSFLDWFLRIILYQGAYGTGESGIYLPEFIPLSIIFWWQYLPVLILTVVLTLLLLGAVAYFSRKLSIQIPPAYFAMTAGLLLQMLLLFLVLSKLFSRIRYVLSIAALLPVLLLITLKLLELTPWRQLWIKQAIYITLLLNIVISLPIEISTQQKEAFVQQDAAIARSLVVTHLAHMKGVMEKDIVVVYSSGTPIKCAGLLMANNWIRAFDQEIAALCPNQHAIYDFHFADQMNLSESVRPLSQINWDLVIWPGNGSNLPQYLYAVGAENIPKSWGVPRAKWFFIHSNNIR